MICPAVRAIYSLAYNTPTSDSNRMGRIKYAKKERGGGGGEGSHLLPAKFTRIEINRATDWLLASQPIRSNLSRQLFPTLDVTGVSSCRERQRINIHLFTSLYRAPLTRIEFTAPRMEISVARKFRRYATSRSCDLRGNLPGGKK